MAKCRQFTVVNASGLLTSSFLVFLLIIVNRGDPRNFNKIVQSLRLSIFGHTYVIDYAFDEFAIVLDFIISIGNFPYISDLRISYCVGWNRTSATVLSALIYPRIYFIVKRGLSSIQDSNSVSGNKWRSLFFNNLYSLSINSWWIVQRQKKKRKNYWVLKWFLL